MKALIKIVAWLLSVIYGLLIFLSIGVMIFKKGFRKVFAKCEHPKPPCLEDPTLGVHGFLKLKDVKIHYVASGPEDKPLMLFVHGFPEFWYSWRYQLREFQKDYRCVAFDQRGYGESDKPSGMASYHMKHLMEDVKEVIQALGYKKCILVAHDWGGAVAWAFGRNFPEMVDKLIVMNVPPVSILRKIMQSRMDQFRMSWYIFFFQLPYFPEWFLSLNDIGLFDAFSLKNSARMPVTQFSQEDVKAYKHTFSRPGAWTPPLNFYRASMQIPPVKYDLDYTFPILLVWGMKDTALCSALPDEVEKVVPTATVKRIAEASHFVQMDAPDTVNQMMREWLSANN